jgi:uncharacterized membrane protein YfhO
MIIMYMPVIFSLCFHLHFRFWFFYFLAILLILICAWIIFLYCGPHWQLRRGRCIDDAVASATASHNSCGMIFNNVYDLVRNRIGRFWTCSLNLRAKNLSYEPKIQFAFDLINFLNCLSTEYFKHIPNLVFK